MRVDPGHPDQGFRNAQLLAHPIRQSDHLEHSLGRDVLGQGVQQRDVRRHVADAQVAAGEHHAIALGAGQRRQHFGVSGKRAAIPAQVERLFVDRVGHNRVDLVFERQLDRSSRSPRPPHAPPLPKSARTDSRPGECCPGRTRSSCPAPADRSRSRTTSNSGSRPTISNPWRATLASPITTGMHTSFKPVICQRLGRDLASDPGRIAHRQSNDRQHRSLP